MAVYKVLVSTVVINCLVKGSLKSLGVLMMELDSLGVDPTVASWIPAIAYTLFAVMSSPVARLEKWFSHQVMSIAGCVIIVLGVIISAFPFLPNLYIGLGVFLGTGGCLCAISGVLEINKRFTGSSRGLAHGFSLAGNTVGGLVLPALIAVMMDRYGYTGALLLLSAIILNIIPASLLYTNTKLRPVISDGQPSSSESGKEVFRNSRLWFCIFSMASTTVGYTNFGLYLPLHLHSSLGWSKPLSAGCISVFAVGDLLGRLTGPALSDRFPPRWPWYCAGLAGAGTFILVVPVTSSMATVGALTLAAGLCSGLMVGVYPALLSDELGPDNLSVTYPLSQTVAGILNLAGPPILGLIAQLLTTSHVMILLGASLIMGSVPLALSSLRSPLGNMSR